MITAQLISTFVFAKQIEQSHFFLNPKFQASSHLLWPYSPVCVKPGQKPPKTGFLMSQFIYHCFLVMFFFLFHTRNLHSFMQEIYVNNKVPYLIINCMRSPLSSPNSKLGPVPISRVGVGGWLLGWGTGRVLVDRKGTDSKKRQK